MENYHLPTVYAEYERKINRLKDDAVIKSLLPVGVTFVTIAFAARVTGKVRQVSGRWHAYIAGIDRENLVYGYLWHDDASMGFVSEQGELFTLSFDQVSIRETKVGPVIRLGDTEYFLGDFRGINQESSPPETYTPKLGGRRVIWMDELAKLGIIDPHKWEQDQKRRSIAANLWLIGFGVLIAVALVYAVIAGRV